MDVIALHRRTTEYWMEAVSSVGDADWSEPTPCSKWTVRDLVNHVVGEDRWTPPLVLGRTIAEVGTEFDGDLLGDDPVGAARSAADEAETAVAEFVPAGGKVHLSYGDEDIEEYIYQLAADHLVHGWDLAVATGGPTRMDPELVAAIASWFADKEAMYRAGGVVGPQAAVTGDDPQADLLARFGREASWVPTKLS